MPRNGSGIYNLPAGNPVVTLTTISSNWANTTLGDLAAAMTDSLSKDGQTVPTANLPMGGYRHTNVGDAQLRSQYITFGQAQDNYQQRVQSLAGTNNLTGNLPGGFTTLQTGQFVLFTPVANNTGAVTLNLNGTGAKDLKDEFGGALSANDLVLGVPVAAYYNGTEFRMITPTASGGTSPYVKKAGDTMTGNLVFSGNGLRVRGNFTAGTLSDSTALQTTAANSNTHVPIIPSGTAQTASVYVANSSDLNNSSYLQFYATIANTRIQSLATGSASPLPIDFYVGATNTMSQKTDGYTQVLAFTGGMSDWFHIQNATSGVPEINWMTKFNGSNWIGQHPSWYATRLFRSQTLLTLASAPANNGGNQTFTNLAVWDFAGNNLNLSTDLIFTGAFGIVIPDGSAAITAGTGSYNGEVQNVFTNTNTNGRWYLGTTGNVGFYDIGRAFTRFYSDTTGTLRATTFQPISALKYKEDIAPARNLALLDRVEFVTYRLKDRGTRAAGVIADNMVALTPDFVSYAENGEIESFNYDALYAVLFAEVRDRLRKLEGH